MKNSHDTPIHAPRYASWWLGAYIFAGFIALLFLTLRPGDSNRLLVVLEDGMTAEQAWSLLDRLDARLVAVMSSRVILIDTSSHNADWPLRQPGILVALNGSALRGCGR